MFLVYTKTFVLLYLADVTTFCTIRFSATFLLSAEAVIKRRQPSEFCLICNEILLTYAKFDYLCTSQS